MPSRGERRIGYSRGERWIGRDRPDRNRGTCERSDVVPRCGTANIGSRGSRRPVRTRRTEGIEKDAARSPAKRPEGKRPWPAQKAWQGPLELPAHLATLPDVGLASGGRDRIGGAESALAVTNETNLGPLRGRQVLSRPRRLPVVTGMTGRSPEFRGKPARTPPSPPLEGAAG